MPLYYFHIYQDGGLIRDEEGSVCADLEAAKCEAQASATDLARQALADGRPVDDLCVEIHDAAERVLAGLTIREVLSNPAEPRFDPSCAVPGKGRLH
jgi:hypothetical protein